MPIKEVYEGDISPNEEASGMKAYYSSGKKNKNPSFLSAAQQT